RPRRGLPPRRPGRLAEGGGVMLGLVLLPLVGAALALGLRLLRKPRDALARWLFPTVAGLELLLAIRLAVAFSDESTEGPFVETFPLLGSLLGIDGISLAMLLFTTGLAFLASLTSLGSNPRLLERVALLLLALAGIVGVLVSL